MDINNSNTNVENTVSNYRSAVITEPNLMPPSNLGGASAGVLRTPFVGNVRALPPPLPAAPALNNNNGSSYGVGYGNSYGVGGYGAYGGGYGSTLGGYGGYGGFGSSLFGGYGGYGAYGNAGGLYNRFGGAMNPMDPEARFIQMAEANSRSAFESIESLVSAIGNIASMLDSTFFALTSSFRAILGVAANFGRLRSVFAQFWQTFAIFRGLTWIYKKILYWLRITKLDPSSTAFKKAYAEAINENAKLQGAPNLPQKGQSPWPVLAFLSFIFTAPYLIMKLLGTVTSTAQEEARDPRKWIQPIETVALYDFQARNSNELSINNGDRIFIAPREIQNTLHLLNTGWALASIDGQMSGIVPINYMTRPQQMQLNRQQQQQQQQQQQNIFEKQQQHEQQQSQLLLEEVKNTLPTTIIPASSTIPNHLVDETAAIDFAIAPQPMGQNLLAANATNESDVFL